MERRYFFKTSAVAAGARLDRAGAQDADQVLAIAPSALPSIGGRSEARFPQPDAPAAASSGAVTVREALTRVVGRVDRKRGASSQADCTVRGFSLFNRVSAELIEAHLQSKLGPSLKDQFPIIQPKGNRLEGVKIGEYPLSVKLDEKLFCDCGDMKSLSDRFAQDAGLQTRFFWRFNAKPGARLIPKRRGSYVCTLVKELKWTGRPHPDVTIDGYRLIWRGVGIIYLGEIVVNEKSRQLTMVRMDLEARRDRSSAAATREVRAADEPPGDEFGSGGGGTVGDGTVGMP